MMNNNILIVDDSNLIRKQVIDTLQTVQLFHSYYEADNGLSAIRILSQVEISMIVCDVMMPGMDGFKLLEFISKEKSLGHVNVIMLSANSGVFDCIRGLENGAVDYIKKPFHPKELILRVKNQLKVKELQNELKIKIAELERVSIMDNLTGLYNSRYLYDALIREYNRCERFNLKLSLVMLDVDNFKEINDSFGHQRGDAVLKEIGRVLQIVLRGYDFAVRYGGDEFMVVLSQNTALGAHIVAERIRKAIEESPMLREISSEYCVTVSVGVATYPDDTTGGYEALINMADNALYKAKREGRNRVASYLKGVSIGR